MVAILLFLHIKSNKTHQGTVLERIKELDIIGTAILIPAVVCLVLALQWGGAEYPWKSAKIIGLFVGFGAMAIIFIAIQLWKGDKATLPPRFFTNRNVVCAMLFALFFGAAFFPLIYYCKRLSRYYPTWQPLSNLFLQMRSISKPSMVIVQSKLALSFCLF